MTSPPAALDPPAHRSPPDPRLATPLTPNPRPRRFDVARNRALLTLMLGHLTVDMYVGVLPVLYPLLTDKFDLNLKTVGLVSLAYSGLASISQPLFGWMADRYGTRHIGIALFWSAITFSAIGFAPSFTVLVICAGLAGIGSGAYHPMGALNASAVIAEKQRNAGLSLYVTGGTLGVAIGPLIGAALFHFFGVRGVALMVIPGAAIALWMTGEMRTISQRIVRKTRDEVRRLPPVPRGPMAVVIGLMMLRAWTMFGIQAFIPTWYEEMGYGSGFYSALATTLLLTSVLGTIGSGALADKHGRRMIQIVSAAMSVPTILLFAQFPGWSGFVTAALFGLLFASTGPLLLVIAQQLMAGRAGMASGLILGLGFVMGALGIPIMGAIGDEYGLQTAIRFQAVVAGFTILLAWLLPTEQRIRQLAERPAT
ncbi:MAG: MFS transporter [Thermomicrobiales bacterium]